MLKKPLLYSLRFVVQSHNHQSEGKSKMVMRKADKSYVLSAAKLELTETCKSQRISKRMEEAAPR
jgi:hypothetical protein